MDPNHDLKGERLAPDHDEVGGDPLVADERRPQDEAERERHSPTEKSRKPEDR